MRRFAWAWLLLLAGCDTQLQNKAAVYPVVTGSFDLNWKPTVANVHLVEFKIDGVTAGRDDSAADGFTLLLDSTTLSNGLHTLGVTAYGDAGQQLTVVDQTILVQN